VSDTYAVGNKCTNAVAMRTPVPKCLERNRNWRGMGNEGNRFAAIGNAQARMISDCKTGSTKIYTKAAHDQDEKQRKDVNWRIVFPQAAGSTRRPGLVYSLGALSSPELCF
jgi:hypothetical protein